MARIAKPRNTYLILAERTSTGEILPLTVSALDEKAARKVFDGVRNTTADLFDAVIVTVFPVI